MDQNNWNNGMNGENPQEAWPGRWVDPNQPQPVKDVFCNLFITTLMARVILALVIGVLMFANDGEMMLDPASYFSSAAGKSYFVVMSVLMVISLASIVFVILDIVGIYQGHYKITGLILFAILLQPGYYIWRAYVLKRKKTFPIIYTVVLAGLWMGYFVYVVYQIINLVVNMVPMMQ